MLLIFWSSISFQKVWFFFFSLVDKFNKFNYFPKQARGLKDSFISCSSMQLAYCQRSFYVLRSIRDVGVLFAFIFLSDEFECEMMEYFIRCLQWPEKLYYNKICCPGLIIWFMEALLGWIVIFFFFHISKCTEHILSVERLNLWKMQMWRLWRKWNWENFSVPFLSVGSGNLG